MCACGFGSTTAAVASNSSRPISAWPQRLMRCLRRAPAAYRFRRSMQRLSNRWLPGVIMAAGRRRCQVCPGWPPSLRASRTASRCWMRGRLSHGASTPAGKPRCPARPPASRTSPRVWITTWPARAMARLSLGAAMRAARPRSQAASPPPPKSQRVPATAWRFWRTAHCGRGATTIGARPRFPRPWRGAPSPPLPRATTTISRSRLWERWWPGAAAVRRAARAKSACLPRLRLAWSPSPQVPTTALPSRATARWWPGD